MTSSDTSTGALNDPVSRRADLVSKAANSWINELIDIGGRNNLLFYRDLKVATLALEPKTPGEEGYLTQLLGGNKVLLSRIFEGESFSSAVRRVRSVSSKAVENFQEKGLQTLYLAFGMATWNSQSSASTPAAPVLLRRVEFAARGGVSDDFELQLIDEWEVNPSLLHLLRVDYKIDLAGEALLDMLEESNVTIEPNPLFDAVKNECSGIEGFSISTRIVIGNFSYAKLPMVLDLENSLEVLSESELICALAGDSKSLESLRAKFPELSLSYPDEMHPQDEFLILDADASQSYAINAVVAGANLVIEGPPGTGKSQTIANLIATLAARGKRVLFVAEKRAAIDAVFDRLKAVGLEDLVLDLHEGAGSRRLIAESLGRAMVSASTTPLAELGEAQENLLRRRRSLVDASNALHSIREPWHLSVYELQARLLRIPKTISSSVRLRGDIIKVITPSKYRELSEDLMSFIGLGGLSMSSKVSPWGSGFTSRTITTPEVADDALNIVTSINNGALRSASDTLSKAVELCGLPMAETFEAWEKILTLFREARNVLELFQVEVFDLPLDQMVNDLAPAEARGISASISKITDSSYRTARKRVMESWEGSKPTPHQLLDAVRSAKRLLDSWRLLAIDKGLPRVPANLFEVEDTYRELMTHVSHLGQVLALDDLTKLSISELGGFIGSLVGDISNLIKIPELSRLLKDLDDASLAPLLSEIKDKDLSLDGALMMFEYVWLISILDSVALSDPLIGTWDGEIHSRTVLEFQRFDRQHLRDTAKRIRRVISERVTLARDNFPNESELISRQARLRRKHLPMRTLFESAPNLLGALKPCVAMSPLVVAQLLPAKRIFDVVIFDEASQVSPADAIGAIMRASQAVVAGDPHQLPPTSFFASSSGEGGEEDEVEDIFETDVTKDMESILDAMSALLPPPQGTRTLGWHYRSRDERLIAFSNAQSYLYDFSMTTFPGVSIEECVRHELVEDERKSYDPSDSAGGEVTRVVALVSEHAKVRPNESLGVITMGISHANRI